MVTYMITLDYTAFYHIYAPDNHAVCSKVASAAVRTSYIS